MTCREILTLQFGSYANFVGSHWWNSQCDTYSFDSESMQHSFDKPIKEINFDCTFREGKTLNNEVTYTPRAVIFCNKDTLGTLKQTGILYDSKSAEEYINTWNNTPIVHQQEIFEKNKFLKKLENYGIDQTECNKEEDLELESSVNVWSDFLKQHLHPKTVEIINYEKDYFNSFGLGVESYKKEKDNLEDKVRFFTEECDNLQGFQLLLDTSDAFSGVASSFFEDYLLDEFYNKAHVLVSLYKNPKDRDSLFQHNFNLMLTYNHFRSASNILPLSTQMSLNPKTLDSHCFKDFTFNPSLTYHTSAILAATFNNITLPYRLFQSSYDMKSFYSSLTCDSRNISAVQLAYPAYDKQPSFTTLTPSLENNIESNLQHITYSGKQALPTDLNPLKMTTTIVNTPFITADPYPHFFPSSQKHHLNLTSMSTSIHNTPDLTLHLSDIINIIDSVKKQNFRKYLGDFIDKDDFSHQFELLKTCNEFYDSLKVH